MSFVFTSNDDVINGTRHKYNMVDITKGKKSYLKRFHGDFWSSGVIQNKQQINTNTGNNSDLQRKQQTSDERTKSWY